jgi:N-acetylglucosamine-6-phosphate deacetylase
VQASGGEVKGGHGRLAGSKLTMAEAVRNLHALGVPLAEALAAATSIPAALAGRPDLGRLAPGRPADIVVLDDALEVRRVLVAGA